MEDLEAWSSTNLGREQTETIRKYGGYICRFIAVIIFYAIGIGYYQSVEKWNTTTCIYFISVSVTTVGYGHYVPTTDGARIFTCFYVVTGIFLVVDFINYLTLRVFVTIQNEFLDKFSPSPSQSIRAAKKILLSVISLFVVLFFGTLFFSLNEPWTVAEAFYWTTMTMTTVGYGDLKLKHESSRQFLIFFVFFVVSIFFTTVNNINESYTDVRIEHERSQILDTTFSGLEMHSSDRLSVMAEDSSQSKFVLDALVKMRIIDEDRDLKPLVKSYKERLAHHNSRASASASLLRGTKSDSEGSA